MIQLIELKLHNKNYRSQNTTKQNQTRLSLSKHLYKFERLIIYTLVTSHNSLLQRKKKSMFKWNCDLCLRCGLMIMLALLNNRSHLFKIDDTWVIERYRDLSSFASLPRQHYCHPVHLIAEIGALEMRRVYTWCIRSKAQRTTYMTFHQLIKENSGCVQVDCRTSISL